MNAFLERGRLLYQREYFSEAGEQFRQALAENPDDAEAKSWLALALVGLKQYAEATRLAQEAVHGSPDDELSHYALAFVWRERNYLQEALTAIREAVRLGPWDAANCSLEAQIHLDLRDWKATLAAAERGLQIDPENIGCNNLRSIALTKLGRGEDASAAMESVLARNPENAVSHATQGWNYLHGGKITPALEHFREAMRLDPNDEWARSGIVEAMKARNPFYALMLKYFLWMGSLSGRAQGMIIFGGYLGNRMLAGFATENPSLALWVLPIRIAYGVFVVSTWLASPLFNLLLRFDRFGRYALSRDQVVATNWLGAALGLCALGLLGGALTGFPMFWVTWAVVFGLLSLPLTSIFNASGGWRRVTLIGMTAGLFLIGLIALAGWGFYALGTAEAASWEKIGSSFFTLFLIGIFVTMILTNFVIFQRGKK